MSVKRHLMDKNVRKILLDPEGRAALKRFGIDIEVVADKKPDERPVVAVLCPTYRAPEPQMRDALGQMIAYTHQKGLATVYMGAPVQSSIVSWSRNWLIAEQLKSGKPWTHVLFIDDDIVVEPDALERLLSHKKDIIAGLCTRRNDPPIPNIRFYDKDSGDTKQIWEWPENQLIEVDSVGTGLMLLTMHAVEQVAQVYFDCLWEQEFYGLAGDKLERLKKVRIDKFEQDKTCYWFRLLPTPKGDIEMGEDIAFCQLAKNYCGLGIFVDSSVLPGHLGSYAYSIRDFIPYRDMCIERCKAEGKYKVQPKVEAELQIVG